MFLLRMTLELTHWRAGVKIPDNGCSVVGPCGDEPACWIEPRTDRATVLEGCLDGSRICEAERIFRHGVSGYDHGVRYGETY